MPAHRDSILESGYWDEVKPEVPESPESKLSAHVRATKWCGKIVRPSFSSTAGGPRKPVRRTAYLDGLRGFAAFLVYWQHHHLWSREALSVGGLFENGFGYKGQYYFACLPGIRLLFTGGHFAVTVFFVISGYVLSTKPLSLIQAGEYLKLGDNVASALFRRWLRLYIPVICTTFLYMTSWHVFGLWTDGEPHQSNYRDELWKWYVELKNFSFIFRQGGEPWFAYNYHSWSIPVEFRGSIAIYTSLLAFSRCTRNARLWCEVGLIFYFMYIVDGWYCSMFISGMLLCDLDLLAANNDLPRWFYRLESFKELIFYNLFVISIYLGGVPSHDLDVQKLKASPGWYFLYFLKPQAFFDYKWFYLFWASSFMVATIPRIPWLKRFFETSFNQYLGRISYALYLVHGPVIWTLGDRVYAAVGWVRQAHPQGIPSWINAFPLSKQGPLGIDFAFFASQLILFPVTFWLAEMVTRVFDEPSVKFAQWLYNRTLAPPVKL